METTPPTPHDSSSRVESPLANIGMSVEERISILEILVLKLMSQSKRREKLMETSSPTDEESDADYVFNFIESKREKGANSGEISTKCARIDHNRRYNAVFRLIKSGMIVSVSTKPQRGPTGKRFFAADFAPKDPQ